MTDDAPPPDVQGLDVAFYSGTAAGATANRTSIPELHSAIYSPTAAGLAWNRVPGTVSDIERIDRYEVRRDGALVDSNPNTSYIDTSLSAGRTYSYEVVAINVFGTPSQPARESVTTPGGGVLPRPAAPVSLRAVIYSSTALGLIWERAGTAGLRHEVLRDGESLGTIDGVTFVDTGLTGGRTYRYVVVAVDRTGRRSTTSGLLVNTTGPAGPAMPEEQPPIEPASGAVLTIDTHEAVSRAALEIYKGVYEADEGVSNSRQLLGLSRFFFDSDFYDGVAPPFTPTRFVCENGGTLVYSFTSGPPDVESFEFDDCRSRLLVYSGKAVSENGAFGADRDQMTAELLQIERVDGALKFTGRVYQLGDNVAQTPPAYEFAGNLEIVNTAGTFVLADAAISGQCGQAGSFNFFDVIEGSFKLEHPLLGGVRVSVSTPVAFEGRLQPLEGRVPDLPPENFRHLTGRLLIEAADGSRIMLEVDNGDELTVDITIQSDDHSETITRPTMDYLFTCVSE